MIKISTPLNQTDKYAVYQIGSQTMDRLGNVYEYHPGTTANGSIYSWAVWNSTGSTTLISSSTIGAVGIAVGTPTTSNYLWYQIKGFGTGMCGAQIGSSSGTALYASGTTGAVTELATARATIIGVTNTSTGAPTNGSGGTVNVYLNYPFMNAMSF